MTQYWALCSNVARQVNGRRDESRCVYVVFAEVTRLYSKCVGAAQASFTIIDPRFSQHRLGGGMSANTERYLNGVERTHSVMIRIASLRLTCNLLVRLLWHHTGAHIPLN